MSRPSPVVVGEVVGSRFGAVVVDAVEPVDGVVRVRGTVLGRDLAVAFGGEEWEQSTRPVVSDEVARSSWARLDGPDDGQPPEPEVVDVLRRCHDVSLGMDFEAKVTAVLDLRSIAGDAHPARRVLAIELHRALASELGHVLGRDDAELLAGLRVRLEGSAAS
ncbi:MAG: hypothetical protein AAFZ07_00355 [Actinomycetota bacterium]